MAANRNKQRECYRMSNRKNGTVNNDLNWVIVGQFFHYIVGHDERRVLWKFERACILCDCNSLKRIVQCTSKNVIRFKYPLVGSFRLLFPWLAPKWDFNTRISGKWWKSACSLLAEFLQWFGISIHFIGTKNILQRRWGRYFVFMWFFALTIQYI